MTTVSDLETKRKQVRERHLDATRKERKALTRQIAELARQGGSADQLAALRAKRDALIAGDGAVGQLDAKIADARRAERAAAGARALAKVAQEAEGMTVDQLEQADRAARAGAREYLQRADAFAALLNDRRSTEAADNAVGKMSPEQRARLLAALQRDAN